MEDRSAPAWFEGGPVTETPAQGAVVAALGLVLQGGTVPAGEAAESAKKEPEAGDELLSWQCGVLWALGFPTEQFPEHHHVKGLVGHQLLKLTVLVFEQAQTPSVVHLHSTKFLLPFVVGALADAVPTAKLLDSSSSLCFLQNRDDLFFTVSLSLHGFGSVCPCCVRQVQQKGS